MDGALMEYVVNAGWQLPVLSAGAWLLIRVAKPSAAAQYRIWVGALALAVVLPLLGVLGDAGARVEVAHVSQVSEARPGAPSDAVVSAGLMNASPIEMASAGEDARDAATEVEARKDMRSAGISEVSEPRPGAPSLGVVLAKVEAMWGTLRLTRRVEVSARVAEWVTGVYLLVTLLSLLRIARAWSAARRLVRDSDAGTLTHEERALVAECARRMRVREPEVCVVEDADALQGPVVVGARRPVLLCPEGFVRELVGAGREDEARAALCHEMAHIKRRDYAANVMCEAMAVGLKWHPVTYGVERRIRVTREMACDAMAAEATASDAEYARCLVGLAERMTTGGLMEQAGAVGLFNGNALEERVMRLMETEKAMTGRAKVVRGVAGAAVMAAAVLVAGMVHVVPARAQAVVAPTAQAAPAAKPEPVVKASAAVETQTPPKPIPVPKAAPASRARVGHRHEAIVSRDGKLYVWENGKERELTPAERARMERKLEAAQRKIAAETARINSPEFRAKIAKAQREAMDAQKKIESGELQKQMAEAKAEIDAQMARMNSPEFKEQIAKAQRDAMEAQKKMMNGDIQRQMAEAKAEIDAQMTRMNSPEFKAEMEKAQRDAMEAQKKMMNGDIQRQMAEAQKELQKQLDELKAQDAKDKK